MSLDVEKVIKHFKSTESRRYNEERHCKLLLEVMSNKDKGTVSAFCVEAMISDVTFWNWVNVHEVFADLYSFCKMYSREAWEKEGRDLRDLTFPIGTVSYAFEYWRLIGWSRFGVSKNSRIRLNLNPNDSPDKHYAQLLKQASEGDFTAGEIKQLMEAVNVGLNTHQVFQLQKEIDQLKSDLATIAENSNGNNTSTTKGIAQKD